MVEMVVAMVIMLIGLLTLAQVIGYALTISNRGRSVTNTKLLVVSILEQAENLRNTGQLTFGQIANAGGVDNTGASFNFGGFPTGFKAVSVDPGADGIYGTSDDTTPVRAGLERQIVITTPSANLKKIVVTIRYQDLQGRIQTQSGTGYLNNDARSNLLH